ncbi:MAG: pectinesterase family protein [Acholeplasmataceae bacterium]
MGKVTVVVNQALTEASGTEKAGVIHVKTVKEAINLIEKSGLDNNVVKVIEVKDGTYFEKIKISTPNVILRGESQEGTIIDHNHGAGDQKPLGGAWGHSRFGISYYFLICQRIYRN